MKTSLLAAAVLLASAPAQASSVAPHRAIYDLTLMRADNSASLSSVDGRLAFEIQGSGCEGWTISFRMATKYRPAEGEVSLIDTQSTSYEGPDALDFRHQMKEAVNGHVKQDSRIKVSRVSIDAEGKGEVTAKVSEAFALAPGTILPMQHQLKLMALGEAGGGRDSSTIYDGSDGAKTFRAISFVGRTKSPGSIRRDTENPEAAPLRDLSAWPMTVSYFPDKNGEETPDYQVSFDMYENGVATGLVLDYGAFALSGTLTNLQMLQPASCP